MSSFSYLVGKDYWVSSRMLRLVGSKSAGLVAAFVGLVAAFVELTAGFVDVDGFVNSLLETVTCFVDALLASLRGRPLCLGWVRRIACVDVLVVLGWEGTTAEEGPCSVSTLSASILLVSALSASFILIAFRRFRVGLVEILVLYSSIRFYILSSIYIEY